VTDAISEDAEYLVVVRRGATDVFLALKARLEVPGQTQVIWDRRVGERRVSRSPVGEDRRGPDRRQTNLTRNVIALLLARTPSKQPAA
jgi:hypothetical protein